jgi:hypothetical protein
MSSTLKVDYIEGRTGDTPIYNGYELDQWRLDADDTTDGNHTLTNWERVDDATSTKIGTGMSVSSGIFSFPRTGTYLVSLNATIHVATADSFAAIECLVATDGSSFDDATAYASVGGDGETNSYLSSAVQFIFNCTNTSTHVVSFKTNSIHNDNYVSGNSGYSYTHVTFERKGPSQ